jgi:hypothetical protein
MMLNHAYCQEEIVELFFNSPRGKLETSLWTAILAQSEGAACVVHSPFWGQIFKATEI